ncbi:MAG TPA: hypothetical protein VFW07_10790 [Parafilimonas sp.]|nr:hypothetical protein [Parafilimonas sp.]
MKAGLLILACFVFIQVAVNAQMKIGDNPTNINGASLLELESANKGLVFPRVALDNVALPDPLTPGLLTGTVVYNTKAGIIGGNGVGLYIWNGTVWMYLSTGGSSTAWSLTGNNLIDPANSFIGTTNAADFVVKTNNIERFRILGASAGPAGAGWAGLGIALPRSVLDVTGAAGNANVFTIQNTSNTGYSSMDIRDDAGNLVGTLGYVNTGVAGQLSGKNYLSIYNKDFVIASNPSTYNFFIQGSNNGYVGINTGTPQQRLHVNGNLQLDGAFMPGGNAGTAGQVLTSTGINTPPSWQALSGSAWSLAGNAGTNPSNNFLGTTDGQNLVFRTNNAERMRMLSTGNIGIGTTAPGSALDIKGALRLSGSTSGFVGFQPAAAAGGTTYTLPTVDGTSGQQLTTNGSGVLSWTNQTGTTTNSLSLSGNTLTSTVNGIAANSNAVSGVSNASTTNTLTTTVNGVTGTGVNIINSNALSLSGSNLTSIVNGVTSAAVNISPAITSNAWSLAGNGGTSASANFIGTTDAVDFIVKTAGVERIHILGAVNGTSQAGWVGIGSTLPRSRLDVTGAFTKKNVLTLQNTSNTGYSSVDMMDNSGILSGTFGYANTGTSTENPNIAGRNYFLFYGKDFIMSTSLSGSNSNPDFFVEGDNGNIGIGTNAPSQKLHVSGNIRLEGALMPGNDAGTTGEVLISAGTGTSPVWRTLVASDIPSGSGNYIQNSTSPQASSNFNISGNGSMGGNLNVTGTSFLSNAVTTNSGITNNGTFKTTNGLITLGNSSNNIIFGRFTTIGGVFYTAATTGQIGATDAGTAGQVLTSNGPGNAPTWQGSGGGGSGWLLTGNTGTNSGTNYIGTTDLQGLTFKVNNTQAGFLGVTGATTGATSFGLGASAVYQSTAIGAGAQATGANSSMAIGYQATASKQNAVAVGTSSVANFDEAIAIGLRASAGTYNGIAIGTDAAVSSQTKNIAIGYKAIASVDNGIAIGSEASVSSNAIAMAIGPSAIASGYISAAFGYQSQAIAQNTLAMGNAAIASGYRSMAIGNGNTASADNALSVGTQSSAKAAGATAVGVSSTATGINSEVFGNNSTASGESSIAIGNGAKATQKNATAFGSGAQATAEGANSFGISAIASGTNTTAIGNITTASGANAVTLGDNTFALSDNTIAIGNGSQATFSNAVAIGYTAKALAVSTIAFGNSAQSSIDNSIAFGYSANASGSSSLAIGNTSAASATNSMAIGNGASASSNIAVAIGNSAVASAANTVALGFQSQASKNSATAIGDRSSADGINSIALGYSAKTTAINTVVIGNSVSVAQSNAFILGNSTNNVGIATTTPNTGARLDVAGTYKMGASGTVSKNTVMFASALASTAIPAGTGGNIVLGGVVAFTASSTDITVTIPSNSNYLTSTQAAVNVSPSFDLPVGVSIASARMISTSQVKIRFVNATTTAYNISGSLYISINEF